MKSIMDECKVVLTVRENAKLNFLLSTYVSSDVLDSPALSLSLREAFELRSLLIDLYRQTDDDDFESLLSVIVDRSHDAIMHYRKAGD